MREKAISARRQRVSVITAGFGQNMVLTMVSTFMLVYLLEYAHISVSGMAVVTAILTAAKIFDAVNDPFMGSLVDMTRTRWGKLRPYILFSAAPVAVLSAALFCIPDAAESVKLVFFGVCYFLWDIAYTMCDVPYWGLIGAAFPHGGERNGVIAHVRAFGAIALGLATLGVPWLARLLSFSGETTASGWSFAAILVSVTGMGLFLLAFFNTREAPAAREDKTTVRQIVKTLTRNKPLLTVLLGSVLGFGRNIVQAGGAVFAVIAYRDESYFTLIGAAIIAGMVLSSFAAPRILQRISGKALILASSLAGTVSYLVLYFLGFENLFVMMAMIFLTGLTLGLFMVAQTTMIADSVDENERATGVRNDGLSFSMLTFVSKIMNALSVMVFGVFVVWAGYQEGVAVTERMRQIVFSSITLVPAASCLLSVFPFCFYKMDKPKEA